VAFAMGDGGRLPVRDGVFDLAVCIGAPSIVGTEPCLSEMCRALRPGGAAVVSDWVWAKKPVPPEAIPLGYDIEPLTLDDYGAILRRAGFATVDANPLPQSAWDAYYAPLRQTVAALRERDPGAPYQPVEDEMRVYDIFGAEYWRYAVFIGRA
jgi:SAM-dependent methyltransferase